MRKPTVIFCTLSLLLLLAACGSDVVTSDAPSVPPADNTEPASTTTLSPDTEPTEEATPTPEPAFPLYTFGSPLEESEPVEDDSFFDDAVFLGDSRTHGLLLYSGLTNGDFYYANGMSVFGVDSTQTTFDVDGQEVTMVGALSKKQYGKVYVMLGVNELGAAVSSYEEALASFVDKIIAAQPNAVVYIQTQAPVNDVLASQNLAASINNNNVNAFNEAIARVAAEKRVVLLDTGAAFRGPDGQLPADMTWDGCHFHSSGYSIWADYLRSHTMDPERYFYYRDQEPTSDTNEGSVGLPSEDLSSEEETAQ